MLIVFFLDFISFVLLIGSFLFLQREKKRFYSLKPILPAFLLIAIGRICDMAVEHPTFRLSNLLGVSTFPIELAFSILGNITDVVGICFLIYGFVKILKYEETERKRIQELETLLPICANCKKYRNEGGEWLPIEKYLVDNGPHKLSHGICPDCLQLLYPSYGGRPNSKK